MKGNNQSIIAWVGEDDVHLRQSLPAFHCQQQLRLSNSSCKAEADIACCCCAAAASQRSVTMASRVTTTLIFSLSLSENLSAPAAFDPAYACMLSVAWRVSSSLPTTAVTRMTPAGHRQHAGSEATVGGYLMQAANSKVFEGAPSSRDGGTNHNNTFLINVKEISSCRAHAIALHCS